jgi:hypothetical protein
VGKEVNKDRLMNKDTMTDGIEFLVRKKMNKQIRKNKVKEALSNLKVDGIEVSDYCRTQINEYINGRMTHKMLLQMLDEWYLTEVVKR